MSGKSVRWQRLNSAMSMVDQNRGTPWVGFSILVISFDLVVKRNPFRIPLLALFSVILLVSAVVYVLSMHEIHTARLVRESAVTDGDNKESATVRVAGSQRFEGDATSTVVEATGEES